MAGTLRQGGIFRVEHSPPAKEDTCQIDLWKFIFDKEELLSVPDQDFQIAESDESVIKPQKVDVCQCLCDKLVVLIT